KSTSRDEFGVDAYLRDALMARRNNSIEDLTATVTAAVAYSVIRAYNRFVKPQFKVARVIVSGGGAANKALMKHLKKGLNETVIRTADHYGLPYASLDAIAYAVLANETLCGLAANVPQATGARHPVLLGKITPA
ncbi:MAG: anhydro-N-acetylmuramic acid kinase, partial [Rhodopirellula sp.]|nr:anhydro-N-acetylmuramic acid kinase [Rhodopirellula sp.]